MFKDPCGQPGVRCSGKCGSARFTSIIIVGNSPIEIYLRKTPYFDQAAGARFKCSLPHVQRTSKTGTNVLPYGVSEYHTRSGRPRS